MIALHGQGTKGITIAAHAVSRGEYKLYLHTSRQPVPAPLAKPEAASEPVTCVSQIDAGAYCRWLSAQEARSYRLPKMSELEELTGEVPLENVSTEIWPHHHGNRPELRGGMNEIHFCEWTAEVERLPGAGGRPDRILGSIFYPPWLRHGNNAAHAQAHLSATEGYSFVTFRLACDLESSGP
jgi:hypothetical protein